MPFVLGGVLQITEGLQYVSIQFIFVKRRQITRQTDNWGCSVHASDGAPSPQNVQQTLRMLYGLWYDSVV
jgi:hypothetical protein